MVERVPIQDQAREDMMVNLLGLKKAEGRLGHDAEDDKGNIFELKSSTKNSFGTGRDVSISMINKWRKRHWIFANGTNYKTGFKIESMHYCSPNMMKDQFDILYEKFKPDIKISKFVLAYVDDVLVKIQIDRLKYLLDRGMTYNNPHISMKYVKEYGVEIDLSSPKNSLKMIMKKL